jgi:hypothetical protein
LQLLLQFTAALTLNLLAGTQNGSAITVNIYVSIHSMTVLCGVSSNNFQVSR